MVCHGGILQHYKRQCVRPAGSRPVRGRLPAGVRRQDLFCFCFAFPMKVL
jgi:hypothetical protein